MQSEAARDCSCDGGRLFHLFVDGPRVTTQVIKLQRGKRSSYRIKNTSSYENSREELKNSFFFIYIYIFTSRETLANDINLYIV
jgi:hypothetical protein